MYPNATETMCVHCAKLSNAPTSATPHSNLSYQNKRGLFSFGRASDEVFFVCRICQTAWMRKMGKSGYEWTLKHQA